MAGATATWEEVDKAQSSAPSSKYVTWDDVDDLPAPPPVVSDIDSLPAPPPEIEARVAQPTEFEKENQPQGSALSRFGSGAWSQLKNWLPSAHKPDAFELATAGMGPLPGAVRSAIQGYEAARGRGQGVIPSMGEAFASPSGIDASGIEERAKHGDVAGVVGEAVPSLVTALLPEGARQTGEAREAIGSAIHTPEGKLTPFSKAVAQATGATAGAIGGHLLNIPEGWLGGLYIGREAGPTFMEKIFPNPHPDFKNVPFAGERTPPVTEAPTPLADASVNPPISVRRGPGQIAPEHLDQPAGERMLPFSGSGTRELPGGGVLVRPTPLLPGKTISSIDALGRQLEQGAGYRPPIPNVPLRDQPFHAQPVGADVLVSARPLPAEEVSDLPFKPSAGQTAGDIVNANTEPEATRPLVTGPQKSKSIREIIQEGPPKEPVAHRATVTHEGKTFGMEAANGRKMYEATRHDTALAKQVHDLHNNEVMHAFVNAGGDVNAVGQEGQRYKVGNSSSRERAQMFDWMLDKGFAPREIVELARRR